MRNWGIILSLLFLCACSSLSISSEDKNNRAAVLYKYAQSNCLFWYFKHKDYDTKDIRAISAGIVEKSNISLDVFTEISLFIRDYSPKLSTKNKIDVNLNKCFFLEDSEELKNIISK